MKLDRDMLELGRLVEKKRDELKKTWSSKNGTAVEVLDWVISEISRIQSRETPELTPSPELISLISKGSPELKKTFNQVADDKGFSRVPVKEDLSR